MKSRLKKWVLLLFTLWPVAYLIISLVLFSQLYDVDRITSAHPDTPLMFFSVETMLVFHTVSLFEIIGLLVFYLSFLTLTDRVERRRKPIWGITIILGHFLAMLVFFYLYIWNHTPARHDS